MKNNSRQALARQWRPKQLSEIKGQPTLVELLTNGLGSGRIHHAYLFSGLRGTGKTTVARVLAKCLNCEKGISANPCLECASCTRIDSSQHIDVLEIDAASRTRVEETRELLENISLAPQSGRYKIYIIDEVHMLSLHSFNALLKTLEEPPGHVIFILATTDPQKIPATVRSRTLHVPLLPIATDVIAQQLGFVLQQEGVVAEQGALDILAAAGGGSMRDALSIAERAIAISGNNISTQAAGSITGLMPEEKLEQLLIALSKSDITAMQSSLAALREINNDSAEIIKALGKRLFELTLAQISASTDNMRDLLEPTWVQNAYDVLIEGQKALPWAPSASVGLEMTLLRIMHFSATDLKPITPKPATNKAPAPKPQAAPTASAAPVAPVPQAKVQVQQGDFNWNQSIEKLGLEGLTKVLAKHCVFERITDSEISFKIPALQKACATPERITKLQEAINAFTGVRRQVKVQVTDEKLVTPHAAFEAEKQAKHDAAKQAIENNPVVQAAQSALDARITDIEVGSLK